MDFWIRSSREKSSSYRNPIADGFIIGNACLMQVLIRVCRRKNNAAEKREMVGGKTFSPSQLNNFRFPDLDGRRHKNIIELEPEEKSSEPVIGCHLGMIRITVPEGVS